MEITIYIPIDAEWHTASEEPPTDVPCIVETKNGAMYFQKPVQGKFLKDVEYWMKIPNNNLKHKQDE